MKSSVAAAAFDAPVLSFETTDSLQSEGSREQNAVCAKLAREQAGLIDKTYEGKKRKRHMTQLLLLHCCQQKCGILGFVSHASLNRVYQNNFSNVLILPPALSVFFFFFTSPSALICLSCRLLFFKAPLKFQKSRQFFSWLNGGKFWSVAE